MHAALLPPSSSPAGPSSPPAPVPLARASTPPHLALPLPSSQPHTSHSIPPSSRRAPPSCAVGVGMAATKAGLSAVMQDRLHKLSLVQLHRQRPSSVIERDVSRKQLLDEVAGDATPSPSAPRLVPRDVRNLDPVFALRHEPSLLVRAGAILLSLGPCQLHAIVRHDTLYLLLPHRKQSSSALAAAQETLRVFIRLLAANEANQMVGKTVTSPTGITIPPHSPPQLSIELFRAPCLILPHRPPSLPTPPLHMRTMRTFLGRAEGKQLIILSPIEFACLAASSPLSGPMEQHTDSGRGGGAERSGEGESAVLPFALLALEAILVCACSRLQEETEGLKRRVDRVVHGIRQAGIWCILFSRGFVAMCRI